MGSDDEGLPDIKKLPESLAEQWKDSAATKTAQDTRDKNGTQLVLT